MNEFHVKESLYKFFDIMKEMSEFCKSVRLRRFINKKNCKGMYNNLHYSIIVGS